MHLPLDEMEARPLLADAAPVPKKTASSPEPMLQIAFAGHNRPQDLGHRGEIAAGLARAFALLRAAGVERARLLTGLASGADELAATAWRDAGLGPIHAVLPFLDFALAQDIGPGGLADSATWLDGAAAEAQGRNPHLKQTRLIVEAADLVVVVWTGGAARGAGGTADAVLSALELGLPVLWIEPSRPQALRLIRPENLPADFHFPEFQEALHRGRPDHVEPATVDNLRALLGFDEPEPEPVSDRVGGWREALDELLHATLWKTYAKFRNLVGGRAAVTAADVPLPESLQTQPGFRLLSAAYAKADHLANRLSAVHRSEQLLLILVMVAAAAIGSAWSIWPEVKLAAVQTELALSVLALLVWAVASDARQHERWSEYRYLAERLRLERAGWALGVGLARAAAGSAAAKPGVWRQARRAAGLPDGRFDAERARSWGAWALNELVQGQAAYHRAIGVRDARLAHRIHLFEDLSFLLFFVIFTLYVSFHAAGAGELLPHWFSGVVAMTGSVVPAVAAAAMALEAKLEFQEQSSRSRRIAGTLDRLVGRLPADPPFDAVQNLAREAVRLHLAESSHWQEGAGRRRLFRP